MLGKNLNKHVGQANMKEGQSGAGEGGTGGKGMYREQENNHLGWPDHTEAERF